MRRRENSGTGSVSGRKERAKGEKVWHAACILRFGETGRENYLRAARRSGTGVRLLEPARRGNGGTQPGLRPSQRRSWLLPAGEATTQKIKEKPEDQERPAGIGRGRRQRSWRLSVAATPDTKSRDQQDGAAQQPGGADRGRRRALPCVTSVSSAVRKLAKIEQQRKVRTWPCKNTA